MLLCSIINVGSTPVTWFFYKYYSRMSVRAWLPLDIHASLSWLPYSEYVLDGEKKQTSHSTASTHSQCGWSHFPVSCSHRQWGLSWCESVRSCPGCAHRAEAVSGTVPKPFTFGLSKSLDSQCPWVLRKIHIIAVRSFSLQSLEFLAPKHCIFNTLKIFSKQHRYHL